MKGHNTEKLLSNKGSGFSGLTALKFFENFSKYIDLKIFNYDELEKITLFEENVDLDTVFVTHSEADSSCEYLMEKVKEVLPEANVVEAKAGCIISTHCGPGTIGVLYILKH